LPTCGLALTEAERVRDGMVGEIVARMARWGVDGERVSIRITGCPNGCARPYSGDIGIVGRIPGFYSIYVGGDFEGTRLNEVVAERIRLGEVADVLDPLFALFAASRRPGEGFGDFCHRIGVARLREVLAATREKVPEAAD
jgi:sulfite reductase (ferredoxin)